MIKRLFLLAALTGVWSVSAQNGTLHLRLVDRVTREPVVGAVAELRSQADTARTPFYAASDIDGVALLQRVPAGAWRLRGTSRASCGLRAGKPISERWRCRPAPKRSRAWYWRCRH